MDWKNSGVVQCSHYIQSKGKKCSLLNGFNNGTHNLGVSVVEDHTAVLVHA